MYTCMNDSWIEMCNSYYWIVLQVNCSFFLCTAIKSEITLFEHNHWITDILLKWIGCARIVRSSIVSCQFSQRWFADSSVYYSAIVNTNSSLKEWTKVGLFSTGTLPKWLALHANCMRETERSQIRFLPVSSALAIFLTCTVSYLVNKRRARNSTREAVSSGRCSECFWRWISLSGRWIGLTKLPSTSARNLELFSKVSDHAWLVYYWRGYNAISVLRLTDG